MSTKSKDELEKMIDEIKPVLFEIHTLVKICALATESCVIEEELQMRGYEELFVMLKRINALLIKVEKVMDI